MPADFLIKLENISFNADGRRILHDINLTINQGELLTMVGPNGAGKSTLLKIILGQIRATSGKISRQQKIKMAFVPQSFTPPADLPITVRRFLSGLLPNNGEKNPLEELNIAHLLDSPLKKLSGGETQRLLLARAMLIKPHLIALDEPASGIDPSALGNFYRQIRQYQTEHQCAIVLVSHDLHLVMKESDRVLCLNGHLCCQGKPQEIVGHPDYIALLGDNAQAIGVYTHHHNHSHI
ncbi:MAG: ATP-binding cassette domain-containing protein [Cardiobacteriaceae bacterium]|nr:ATP-binding cassette domain-containing protein [Cardiobacteriaceae bacterium]